MKFLFIVLSCFLPYLACAQRKVNISLFGGFSNYTGELQAKRFTLDQSRKAFGAGLTLRVLKKMYLHGTLTKGQVTAHDKFSNSAERRARNLEFVSNLYEASLTAELLFRDLDFASWSPYVFAGGAIFRFNPNAPGAGELRLLSTEGQGIIPGRKEYGIVSIGLPVGAGIKLRISDAAQLGYHIGFRKTFTDYIDDVSTTYVDEDLLRQNRGQQAVDFAFRGDEVDRNARYPAAGTIRGSAQTKDWYYFSGITLYIAISNADGKVFGKTIRRGSVDCPKAW